MNKRYLLLLLTIFCTIGSTIHAQSSDQKFHFGLKISPTLAWLKPDTKGIEKGGSKLGFSYGIMTEFNIQDNYAFVTGVQVTYRGGKLKYNNGLGQEFKEELNLQYVELPITLKMKTNAFGKYKYFGQFGFVNGINIRAKDGDKNNIKSDINPYNLAMTIALGTEYTIAGNTTLLGSLEFNNGFLDILKSSDSKAITNYFALNVGVLF